MQPEEMPEWDDNGGFGAQNTDSEKMAPPDIGRVIVDAEDIICTGSNNVWHYDGMCWRDIGVSGLRRLCRSYDSPANFTSSRLRNIVEFVMTDESVHYDEPFAWNRLKDTEIPFKNGVLDFVTGKLRDHTARDFLDYVIPHDYDPDAKHEVFVAAMRRAFACENDARAIAKMALWCEYMGYTLANHAKYKKMLICLGKPNSGKSVFLSVFGHIFGESRVATLPPDCFGDARKMAMIVGKRVNLVDDLDANASIADGPFKSLISGSSWVRVDRKYRDAFSYQATCKHIFASNVLPNLFDSSSASLDRILVLKFDNTVPAKERDPAITEKIYKEIPGIINLAIWGLKNLHNRNGRFTEIPGGEDFFHDYAYEQNPLEQWFGEGVEVDKGNFESWTDLVRSFNRMDSGGQRWTVRKLSRAMRAWNNAPSEIEFGQKFYEGTNHKGVHNVRIMKTSSYGA